jgi:hypothetical protein
MNEPQIPLEQLALAMFAPMIPKLLNEISEIKENFRKIDAIQDTMEQAFDMATLWGQVRDNYEPNEETAGE